MASQGWVSTPNVRGTFDIIWTCVQTIVLCAWTTICPNIPAPDDGPWELFRDKFHFALATFLGPEWIFMIAFLQLQSARTSVDMFSRSGYSDWTTTHGFYADMGGILVQPPGWKSFPVNARQLHYLVTNNHMEYPKLSTKEIKGRGKMDGMARYIAMSAQ